MKQYHDMHHPSAVGSFDVVHCKWAHCSAGDFVRNRGKEQYAALAFEVINDNQRRILSIAPVQFGSRNNQHIVHLDPVVRKIRNEWYKDVV